MNARWTALVGGVLVFVGLVVVNPPDALAGTYTITVQPAPSAPQVDDQLSVSGHVDASGTPAAGATLSVTRVNIRTGSQEQFAAMADASGNYNQIDPQPGVWGTMSYTVTVVGDSSGSEGHGSVFVHRHDTSLTISRARKVVSAGGQAHVTAHLGPTDTNRSLTITARPYEREPDQIRSGPVDPTSGDLSASYTMHRRSRFTARFAGDQKYRPAAVFVVVLARAVIAEHLRGGFATEGAYRLYHSAANPVLAVHLRPQLDGVCLRFFAQRYFNGAWHQVAVGCVRTDADGRAIGVLTGDHHLNQPYRVRARWRGSFALLAKSGAWQRLKFRD